MGFFFLFILTNSLRLLKSLPLGFKQRIPIKCLDTRNPSMDTRKDVFQVFLFKQHSIKSMQLLPVWHINQWDHLIISPSQVQSFDTKATENLFPTNSHTPRLWFPLLFGTKDWHILLNLFVSWWLCVVKMQPASPPFSVLKLDGLVMSTAQPSMCMCVSRQ